VSDRAYLSIGQVLDLLKREFPDLTISKIRFLESQGLLDPERTPSGYRKFYEPDVERLRFILRAQQEHYLPLKVIKGRLGTEGGEVEVPDGEQAEVPEIEHRPSPEREPDRRQAAEREPERRPPPDRRPAPDRTDVERHPAAAPTVGGPAAAGGAHGRPVASPSRPPAAEAAPRRAAANGTAPKPGGSRFEVVGRAVDEADEPVSMTLDELAEAAGLAPADVTELERFGLLTGRRMGGTVYYDADCLEIAGVAAAFQDFGVGARHLRMYRTAVEREAGFFEQVVTPMLKQRNPQARRQAVDTLLELSRLGQSLRAAVLRQALRDYTGS
jgi:DNA-binding transcriptional MerR regulator